MRGAIVSNASAGGTTNIGVFVAPESGSEEPVDNVTVRNLEVEGWTVGVLYADASDGTVRNTLVSGNHVGISVYGRNATDNSLVANTLTGNGRAITVEWADRNRVLGNHLSNNLDGIRLSGASNTRVERNVVSANRRNGIELADSRGNTIRNNELRRNGEAAIVVGDDSADNRVGDNLVRETGADLPRFASSGLLGVTSGGPGQSSDSGTADANRSDGAASSATGQSAGAVPSPAGAIGTVLSHDPVLSHDRSVGAIRLPGPSTTATRSPVARAVEATRGSASTPRAGTTHQHSVRGPAFVGGLAVTGESVRAADDPTFNASGLSVELTAPTSLQIGPDSRLYVSQQYGTIKALTVERVNQTHYAVTAVENITAIKDIPNHDDDGSLNESIQNRLVTGILVAGTAEHPVLYVTSSDPRIGGGSSGEDPPLDTNSGVLSRLRWNGTNWVHTQLVRGLPRSEENHHPNGMALDEENDTLYIAQGGNTNKGAPSNNFAYLPEYALSAAVLSVNLTAIGNSTYDIPTLNGTTEPFGGREGDNQAVLVKDGPVQVHAPGFRNPYDVVLTQDRQLYTVDNGANSDWGGTPIGEGPDGTCTNEPNENNSDTTKDALHYIPQEGYYGGHPNPTRGNESEYPGAVYSTYDRPVECDFLQPGTEDDSLVKFDSSTNGLDEYTSTAFGGSLKEDLLAAGFGGNVWQVELNDSGSGVVSKTALFSNFGSKPLDVTTQGNNQTFNGTVWAATYGSSSITVFTPTTNEACLGTDDPSLDEDGDGFSNADEIDNGADPCSAASVPPDNDGDDVSDLNDFDDDDDGASDLTDPFAVDASDGQRLPVDFQFKPGSYEGTILELGFTGVMTNGEDDYLSLYNESKLTAGGAANVLSLDAIPGGDAYEANDDQQYAFQVGVKPEGQRFTAHTTVNSPFPDDGGATPVDYQSQGFFVGTGDQDNYVKLVVSANGGDGGIHLAREVDGTFESVAKPTVPNVTGSGRTVDLYMTVDPANDTVTAWYSIDGGENVTVGTTTFPGGWTGDPERGLALGVIATSRGPGEPFSGTWSRLETTNGTTTSGNQPPAASFDYAPASPEINETVTFDGSASSDVDGTITSYEWDLDGDGTVDATGETVTYAYATNGTKTVTLTVTDNDSATDQVTRTVTVGSDDQRPEAAFTYSPLSPAVNETITFNGSTSSDADGSIVSHEWDFDGDGTTDATGETVTHTYATNGTKSVTLTVTDNDSATDQATETVEVTDSGNFAPTADFSYSPSLPTVGETVTFDGSLSSDADGTVQSYEWDFDGDGTVDATGESPTYAYSTEGIKTATLTVTDNDSATDQVAKSVSVTNGSGTEEVVVGITENSGINESTYGSGSFQVSNVGETNVTQVVLDLSTAKLPDLVFDPNGTAGDTTAKNFTVDSEGGTGYTSHDLRQPHEGNPDDGYDVLVVNFSDFQSGETFAFSIDVDPTSIKGVSAPGPAESGSVSGLELTRATVTTTFENGTVQAATPFSDGSPGGSRAVARTDPLAAPTIDVPGVSLQSTTLSPNHTAATVTTANQTVEVSGPAGAPVRLLRVEGGLFTDGVPDGGYDLEAYEANSVINVSERNATIGSDGTVNVSVTLTNSTDTGGLNYLTAVVEDGESAGLVSDVVVLRYDPATAPSGAEEITSCGVIDSPGTYGLAADVVDSSAAPCLHVTASDVVIDGAGRTLDGDGSGGSDHVGILVGQTGMNPETIHNVTVENLVVTDWNTGIRYGQVSDGRVRNNVVRNATSGIQFFGDTANANHVVSGNAVTKARRGIAIEGTSDSEFLDNDVSGNYDGLYLARASGNAVRNTTLDANTHRAVVLAGTGADNSFSDLGIDGTPVSFRGRNVSLASVSSLPSEPDGKDAVGGYVKARETGTNAFVNLSVGYSDATVANESTVSLWRYDGSWTELQSTLDTAANVVTANSTRPGTFAPMADELTGTVSYRVNAGGAELAALDDATDWSADTSTNPSPYTNAGDANSDTFSTSDNVTLTTSVPSYAPAGLFQSERWDATSGQEMQWDFPVTANATYEVRLYFAEIYYEQDGQRTFDVTIEGQLVLDDYDIHADVGHDVGVTKAFQVTPDDNLDVDFAHVVGNPKVSAIEVVKLTDNTAPTANITYSPLSPAVNETITFDGSGSSDPDGTIQSYAWDFDGDGTTDATGETVTHTYSTNGTKTVTLTVTDNESATDQASVTVNVTESGNQPPTANATYSPLSPAVNETVTFDGSESSDPDGFVQSYEWDLDGDGTIDETGREVNYTYETTGNRTVTLTVTDNESATDQTSITVNVTESGNFAPTAEFTYSPENPTVNETITFDGSGSSDHDGSIQSYAWDFDGDGTVDATGETVTHTYTATGPETVTLTVTDNENATDTTNQTLTVGENAVAYRVNAGGPELAALDDAKNWSADDPSPYTNAAEAKSKTHSTGNPITLDDSVPSTTPAALFQSERWDKPSGQEMQWDFPVTANATYEVRLYFAEIYFEQDDQREFDVTLEAEGTVVLDDYDIHADVGHDVGVVKAFRLTPDDTLDVDFYHETENPKVSGFEVIRLTNNTNNDAPAADFTHSPSLPDPGQTITFNGSASSDSDGSIQSYEWDFDGDGTIDETGQEVTYTYETNGTKRAVLTVVDDDGGADIVSKTVNVTSANQGPTAAFTYSPQSPSVNETVTFDGSGSSDPDGFVQSYEWDLDGDGTIDETGQEVNYTYETTGNRTVTLTVTDNESATDQATQTVNVTESGNFAPTAEFTYSPFSPVVNETITFDGSGSSDPDGFIQSYAWDFDGDGTIDETGQEVTYNYSTTGTRAVTLTVTDNESATDTTNQTLTVGENAVAYRVNAGGPELAALDDAKNWSADDPSPYTNAAEAKSKTYSTSNPITLDDSVPSSTPAALFQSERWDAESGTEMQWDFPVTANATYEVRLYFAEIYHEQNDQREFDVTLEAEGTVVLNDYDIHADVGHDVGVVKAFRLTPDDTLDVDFYHEKGNPKVSGFEVIRLTNNTNNEAPTANVTYSPSDPAVNETITFDGSASSDVDGSIQSYEWDFDGDGTVDRTGQEVTYTYETNGTKRAVLTVVDDDGGADIVSQTVNVTESGSTASVVTVTHLPEFRSAASASPDAPVGGELSARTTATRLPS